MSKQSPDYCKRNFTWENLGQPHYIALVQSLLDTGLDVRFTVTGRSMRPFLRGNETVTLRKESPEKLRIGDLIFFLNNRSRPILHRIVLKKSENGNITLYTKGDALSYLDEPITAENILGKVTQIELAGQKAPVKLISPGFRYTLAWMSRLQIHCRHIRLLPGLHRRIYFSISSFIVFIAAR